MRPSAFAAHVLVMAYVRPFWHLMAAYSGSSLDFGLIITRLPDLMSDGSA